MARLTDYTCSKCGKKCFGIIDKNKSLMNQLCSDCRIKIKNKEKKHYDIEREYNKSLEERIKWIEDWIYEHKKNHGNESYFPPIFG